jgi:hypothetical protein
MKERILRLVAKGKIAINLRGLEYLQSLPGEDEELAWKRLRPKLSYTGRQLDEVTLMVPSAVPTTGGTPQPAAHPVPGAVPNLFGETEPVQAPSPQDSTPAGGTTTPPAEIFGGNVTPTREQLRIPLTNPPTSALNLIGKLEGWGIGPATHVSEVAIKISSATGAQLKELLKKLPDGMTFELSLEREDS